MAGRPPTSSTTLISPSTPPEQGHRSPTPCDQGFTFFGIDTAAQTQKATQRRFICSLSSRRAPSASARPAARRPSSRRPRRRDRAARRDLPGDPRRPARRPEGRALHADPRPHRQRRAGKPPGLARDRNPFADDDPIVAMPAILPDIALFHAAEADRYGNVWIGRRRELAAMAYAARRPSSPSSASATTSLLDDEVTAAGVLPALYVERVARRAEGALALRALGRVSARHGRDRPLCRGGAQRGRLRGLYRPLPRREPPSYERERPRAADRHRRAAARRRKPRRGRRVLADPGRRRHAAAGARRAPRPAPVRISILGSVEHNFFTNGGAELFDCAAQGRIDAFFLGGGQIDGQGNINLVGAGDYPRSARAGPAPSARASSISSCRA